MVIFLDFSNLVTIILFFRTLNGSQLDNAFKQNLKRDVIQCFIHSLRPKLKICVTEKDTFREVINNTIIIERRLAVNSALQKNRNTDYLKTDEPVNNKNTKTTRFNVALEDKIICLIYKKKLGHTTEKCFHLCKAREADLNKQQQNFFIPINKDIVISMFKKVVILILQETFAIIFVCWEIENGFTHAVWDSVEAIPTKL